MARQWELAEEYNETLLGDPVHDPLFREQDMRFPIIMKVC